MSIQGMNAGGAEATCNIADRHRLQPCLAENAAEMIVIDDFSWVVYLKVMTHPLPVGFEWSENPFVQWLQVPLALMTRILCNYQIAEWSVEFNQYVLT